MEVTYPGTCFVQKGLGDRKPEAEMEISSLLTKVCFLQIVFEK